MATPFGGDGYTIRRKGCSPAKVASQLSPERVQTGFTLFQSDIVMSHFHTSTVSNSPIAKAMLYMYTRFEQLAGYVNDVRTQRHKKIGDKSSPMVYTLARKSRDTKIYDLERLASEIEALGAMSAEDVLHGDAQTVKWNRWSGPNSVRTSR